MFGLFFVSVPLFSDKRGHVCGGLNMSGHDSGGDEKSKVQTLQH